MLIYLMGSLRNPAIPQIGNAIRSLGFEVFDDWYGAGPDADDCWQKYEKARGRTYREALYGHAARTIFNLDKSNLERADIGVLATPAGKSAHQEFGWFVKDKPGYVLFEQEPERWDVMYQFATGVCFSREELLETLKRHHS